MGCESLLYRGLGVHLSVLMLLGHSGEDKKVSSLFSRENQSHVDHLSTHTVYPPQVSHIVCLQPKIPVTQPVD